MAKASKYPTTQYTADEFVESAGVILFDLSTKPAKVCLVHNHRRDEWLFAKGRRDCGESRQDAAIREVYEETGYEGRLLPLMMSTRAPAKTESATVADEARRYPDLIEPFMVTIRDLGGESNVKFIWWFIAALKHAEGTSRASGEAEYTPEFFTYEDALLKLTYERDRDILRRAVSLVMETYPSYF